MPPIESYVEEVHEFGESLEGNPAPGIMWVFQKDGVPELVNFMCPCGCGYTCPTPVNPEDKKEHRWLFSRSAPGVTLSPSIRWLSGCRAHFSITDGKVIMHADSGK